MTSKNPELRQYESAIRDLRSAEDNVNKAESKLREIEATLEKHRGELATLSGNADIDLARPLDDLEKEVGRIVSDQANLRGRVALFEQFRDKQARQVATGKIGAFRAEVKALKCQTDCYRIAAQQGFDELVQRIREPLAQLARIEFAAGLLAARAVALEFGGPVRVVGNISSATVLQNAATALDLDCAPVDPDQPLQSLPPEEPACTSVLTQADRDRLRALERNGEISAEEFLSRRDTHEINASKTVKHEPGFKCKDYYDGTVRLLGEAMRNADIDARSPHRRGGEDERADELAAAFKALIKTNPMHVDADAVMAACNAARAVLRRDVREEAQADEAQAA